MQFRRKLCKQMPPNEEEKVMCSMSAPKRSRQDSPSVQTQSSKKTQNNKAQHQNCSCDEVQTKNNQTSPSSQTQQKQTKITVKCNCGFSNNLYIRGEGIQGLSWDKGTPMKCTKADEWEWVTNKPFNHGAIKVVLNDKQYEVGPNHDIDCGHQITFAPKF